MNPEREVGAALRSEVHEFIDKVGSADIVVGIPSYNNARTIGHVVRAVQAGLAKYFPECKGVLVNSDGGSTDGTPQIVRETREKGASRLFLPHRSGGYFSIATPYHGLPGKGSAFRAIFEIARKLNARACAVVDSDLRSITPEWLELLLKPVIHGEADYVAPLYLRHKYDGTITNSIVYPLTRALYGKRIRQPIGGDFGFSGTAVGLFLSEDVWETDVARYGIDIWMTTTALANKLKMAQAYLGSKIHDPKDPSADLSDMLYQVVGSTFSLMERYEGYWKSVTASSPVPLYGFMYEVGVEPVAVDAERMIKRFSDGVKSLGEVWELFLPQLLLDALSRLAREHKGSFHLPAEMWVDIIYYYAAAWHSNVINREHLLKSLTPLYIGRTASWVLETVESDPAGVENKIERLCMLYEEKKQFLIEQWERGTNGSTPH